MVEFDPLPDVMPDNDPDHMLALGEGEYLNL